MSVSTYANSVMEYDDGIPQQTQQTFIAEKVVWDKFLDTNQGNYNFNKVNFSSLGSQGISPDVLQSWSQAYFEPAIQANLEIQPVYEGPGVATDWTALTNKLKFDRTNTNTRRMKGPFQSSGKNLGNISGTPDSSNILDNMANPSKSPRRFRIIPHSP